MLAPHNANSSPAAWERVHFNTLKNLLEGLGMKPEGLVEAYQKSNPV
jgi:D-3-phosphoglycerate dehydrogenase